MFKINLSLSLCFILITLSSCLNEEAPHIPIKKTETFYNNLGQEPENLHPIKSTDYVASVTQSYILESLLERNSDTYQFESSLARKWVRKPDQKTFLFYLRKNLKWSDGQPLTAKDVKFSFDAYKNPAYGGITSLPYYEKLESATLLNDHTILFKAKEVYFGNFQVVATMKIIPKHIYQDPKAKLNKTLIGSGPYKIGSYLKGKMIILTKNSYWKERRPSDPLKKWNFKNIVLRFIPEETNFLLHMQKESLDYASLSAESFEIRTTRRPWGTKVKKYKVLNKQPKGYSYIGLNLKKDLFKDKKVRRALAHLMDRKQMNNKFYFNSKTLATGPWYPESLYADRSVKPIEFNLQKAQKLLSSAGWTDQDGDGILEKNIKGKKVKFSFTVLFSNKESERYLTFYKENLKSSGIQMKLKNLDWPSFIRLVDDRTFDAVNLGWSGGSVDLDPKQLWHSESSRNKGSNFISYSNPEVDTLIDKGRKQVNRKDRIKTFQKVYRLIANDAPYIFMFSSHYSFYGVNQRIQIPKPTFIFEVGLPFWKMQP